MVIFVVKCLMGFSDIWFEPRRRIRGRSFMVVFTAFGAPAAKKRHIFCYIVDYINYKFYFWYLKMGQFEIQFMPAAAWLLSRPPMQGWVLKEVLETIP